MNKLQNHLKGRYPQLITDLNYSLGNHSKILLKSSYTHSLALTRKAKYIWLNLFKA